LTCVVPAIVVIAVLGVGGVWAFRWLNDTFGDLREAARSLPAELAAAKREGLPLEPADLRRKPPVPDSRNAAPYLREMARECEATRARSSAETGDVGAAMRRPGRSAADRQAARDLLERESRMIELAEKVAAKPDCDMDKPYEQGPELMFPEFVAARQAARLLAIRAILSSDSGRLQSAFRDIGAGLRLARHAGREPVVIAMLVQIAIEAIMGAALEQVVLDHIGEPRVIRLAEGTLAAQGPLPSIEHAFRGEVVMGRRGGDLGQLTGSQPSADVQRRTSSQSGRNAFCNASEARVVSFWRRSFASLREHRGDPAAQADAQQAALGEIEANSRKPSYLLVNILAPALTRLSDKVLHMQAQRHLRATLLRIVSYRNRTGAFPRDLAQLGGNVALDPFSGKPLVYRRSERGFVLYSIGMDRKDDGGMAVKPGPDKPVPDIVVQYPRVGPR
jgi:hypothetical protein